MGRLFAVKLVPFLSQSTNRGIAVFGKRVQPACGTIWFVYQLATVLWLTSALYEN
jgi:hypothetical protein